MRVTQVGIAKITVKQLARHEREFQASERACECETKELAQKRSYHGLQELSKGDDSVRRQHHPDGSGRSSLSKKSIARANLQSQPEALLLRGCPLQMGELSYCTCGDREGSTQ